MIIHCTKKILDKLKIKGGFFVAGERFVECLVAKYGACY